MELYLVMCTVCTVVLFRMSLNKNCGFNFGFCVILSVAMKIKVIASVTMNILQHQMIASVTKFASEVLD